MRRIDLILIMLLALLLSACKDRLETDARNDSEILLVPDVEPMTKAANYQIGDITGLPDVKAYKFGFMGYDSANRALNSGADAMKKGISFMWNGSQWLYSNVETYNWYKYTSPIDFYAYFPLLGLDVATVKYQSPYNPEGDVMTLSKWIDGVDVLYGRTIGATSSPVPMQFKHAFAKIEKINFKIPADSPLTFHIAEVELTATHCETDGKIIVRKTGSPVYQGGATQTNRRKTLDSEVVINKVHTSGANFIVSTDNAYLFPVATADIWDGTNPSSIEQIALKKTCVHLKAKVKQGEEIILQGSGEYIIGTETQYGDIYIPIKGTSNPNQELEAGKRYTINILLKKGVGYNMDGKVYQPIELSVTVDDWVDNDVTIGQVTVKPSDVTLNAGNSYQAADIVVNAGHTDPSKLTADCSANLTASFRESGGKLYMTVSCPSHTAGTGSVLVNDSVSNSMTTVNVTVE